MKRTTGKQSKPGFLYASRTYPARNPTYQEMRTRIRLWGNIYEYASAVYTRQHRGVIKCDHLFGHTLLVAYMVTNLLTDNKKSAAGKRRVYSEVVSGARDFVLVPLLMS